MGSSGLPAPVISCIKALPMEVTRSEAWTSLLSISGFGGTAVTRPSQLPSRVFSLSKDFCASDRGADFILDMSSDCAQASDESEARTRIDSTVRSVLVSEIRSDLLSDFMVHSP